MHKRARRAEPCTAHLPAPPGRTRASALLCLSFDPFVAATQGFTGVFLFELVDEWFKKNWNTLDIDMNRKAWHNTLSSEQFYGLVATEVKRS